MASWDYENCFICDRSKVVYSADANESMVDAFNDDRVVVMCIECRKEGYKFTYVKETEIGK